ncbi:hypothetical protein [Hyphomonas sp.]|nr:hypothetical protein [Hyphomonas sp.]
MRQKSGPKESSAEKHVQAIKRQSKTAALVGMLKQRDRAVGE